MRVPSSTPAGMLTDSVRSRVTRPAPAQALQGSSMISPRPWQVGQVRSIEKKPWLARTRPWPPQVGQAARLGAGLGAGAGAGLAGDRGRHADRGVLAGKGLLQPDLEIVAQIGAALAAVGGARAAAPARIAEEGIEDVRHEVGEIRAAAAAAAILEGRMAEAVIGGALLAVLQDLIGLVQFLELGLGRRRRRDCGRDGIASRACGRRSSAPPRCAVLATPRIS